MATVPAGNPSAQIRTYEIKDPSPLPGANYYRLKQTDKDGRFSYSNINLVLWDEQADHSIKIAPQPMKEQATVSFVAKAGKNVFTIFNTQGAIVQTYTLNSVTNGNVQLKIRKDRLTVGVYFYKVVNNNREIYHGKLIVD